MTSGTVTAIIDRKIAELQAELDRRQDRLASGRAWDNKLVETVIACIKVRIKDLEEVKATIVLEATKNHE